MTNRSSSSSKNNNRQGLGQDKNMASTQSPQPALSGFRIPKKHNESNNISSGQRSNSTVDRQTPSTSTQPSQNSRVRGGSRTTTTTTMSTSSIRPRPVPTTAKHTVPTTSKAVKLPTAHLPMDMETRPTNSTKQYNSNIFSSSVQQQQQHQVGTKSDSRLDTRPTVKLFHVGPRERVSTVPSSYPNYTPVSSDGIKRSLPQKVGVKRKSMDPSPASTNGIQEVASPISPNDQNKRSRVTAPPTTRMSPVGGSPTTAAAVPSAFCPQQEAKPPSTFPVSSRRLSSSVPRHNLMLSRDPIKSVPPKAVTVPPPPASDEPSIQHHPRHSHRALNHSSSSSSKSERASSSTTSSHHHRFSPNNNKNSSATSVHPTSRKSVSNNFSGDPMMSPPRPGPPLLAGPSSRHRDSGRSPDNFNNSSKQPHQHSSTYQGSSESGHNPVPNNNSKNYPSTMTASNKLSDIPMSPPQTRPPRPPLPLSTGPPPRHMVSSRSPDGQFSRQSHQQPPASAAAAGTSLTPLQQRLQNFATLPVEELPATRLDSPSTQTWRTSSTTTTASSFKVTIEDREKHNYKNYRETDHRKSSSSSSVQTKNQHRERFPSGSNEEVLRSSSSSIQNVPVDSSPNLPHRSPSSADSASASPSQNRQRHNSSTKYPQPPPPPPPARRTSISHESQTNVLYPSVQSSSMNRQDNSGENVNIHPLPPPSPSSKHAPTGRENLSSSSSHPVPGTSRTGQNNAHHDNAPGTSGQETVSVEQKINTQDQELVEVEENRKALLNYAMGDELPKIKLSASSIISEKAGSLGRPTPKEPQRAHYHTHSAEEEKRYVTELASKNQQHIKIDTNSRPSSNNAATGTKVSYLSETVKVFDRYDFRRKIDPTNLAAYKKRHSIIRSIEEHPIVIIDGYTGCGKSTQVPQLIIDRAFELKQPCNVLVTQPRRIAAISVTRRVCQERGWEMGTVVGYQIGLDKNVTEDTLVTFMTTGVLLQKLRSLKTLKNWTHIIIDEVHERDLEADLLMLLMKKILVDDKKGHERVKIILMSATLDSSKFCQYFTTETNKKTKEAPIIKIPMSQNPYKIEELFLENFVENVQLDKLVPLFEAGKPSLNDELYDIAVSIIVKFDENEQDQHYDPRVRQGAAAAAREGPKVENRGSVLVFLPGMKEINQLGRKLEVHMVPFNLEIIRLHSDIKNEEQGRVFQKPQAYHRKIILATNIAESAITVPDVVYVIDFCLTKSNCVDERTNFNTLQLNWCSISQCMQRKGRTGRVAHGKVYRLVPRDFYKTLTPKPKPQMLRSNIEDVVLKIKAFDMGSPTELLSMALDQPDLSRIEMAVVNLKEIGALTNLTTVENKDTGQKELTYKTEDGDLTFLGHIMSELPLSPNLTRLIALGYCFGVMEEAIIIAAGLSIKSPFVNPSKQELEAYRAKLKWDRNSLSDCFTLLNAYKEWKAGSSAWTIQQIKGWARNRLIHVQNMEEIDRQVDDIKKRLQNNDFLKDHTPINPSQSNQAEREDILNRTVEGNAMQKETALMLKIAIAGAFYPNYFYRPRPRDVGDHERTGLKEVCGHDISNTVYFKNYPKGNCVELYKHQVADYLTWNSKRPFIPFIMIEDVNRLNKGGKVFATFASGSGPKIGGISESMYRALKRRQIRDNLEIQRIRHRGEEEEAYKEAKVRQDRRKFRKCPSQIALPSIDCSTFRAVVTYVESPTEFWVTYSEYLSKLCKMDKNIRQHLMHHPYPKKEIVVGAFCLAPFKIEGNHSSEGLYYRAKIQDLTETEALVYFVDYGNSEWVEHMTLRAFSPGMGQCGLTKEPCLAMKCRLSSIQPATVHGPTWIQPAIDLFKRETDQFKVFDFQVYAVVKSVVIGELIKVPTRQNENEAEPLNLKDHLKKKDLAEDGVEPYFTTPNRSDRIRFQNRMCSEAEVPACNEAQMLCTELSRDFLGTPGGRQYTTEAVRLQGPFSPLEICFYSLCQSTCRKDVQVDNQSVNCVVLDHNVTTSPSRLLIAASINIVDNTQRVTPRETTVMPGIPDIAALMSLTFAPTAELRTDRKYSRYTGALCGLGWDIEREESLYLGHDMDITFETKIDDDDINLINVIRTNLNCLLRSNKNSEVRTETQRQLWISLFRLLKKKRERVTHEEGPREIYLWNQLDPKRVIPPSSEFTKLLQHLDIFPPHSTVQLSERMEDEDNELRWDGCV